MSNYSTTEPVIVLVQGDPAISFNWGSVKELTLTAHIRSGVPSGELLTIESGNQPSLRIYSGLTAGTETLSLVVEIHMDSNKVPLNLSAPWNAIGPSCHDVTIRYGGYFLELYIDGVLLDEEWPLGSVSLNQASVLTYEGVEKAEIHKAVIDMEQDSVDADTERIYLGTEPTSIQYWKPKGFNTGVGDCMPFYDEGVYHLYYLFDRRGHRSKWGVGAHQWAHSSTKDFKHWQHHPMAVGITQEGEGSICTGSVFREEDRYYAFYAVRAVDGTPARLTWAISEDGIHFTKTESYIEISDRYTLASIRDPHVVKDDSGNYHMLITTSIIEGSQKKGCLAHLVSTDLQEWQEVAPMIVPGYSDEPECPDYFQWNGWTYLIFSNNGLARYRYSRNPMGPWLRPAMDVLDCVQMRVPKTAPFGEDRRIAAGFLSSPDKYAGELVLRELVQQADGSLGLKFVPELLDTALDSTELETFQLCDFNGFEERHVGMMEQEYAINFEVKIGYPNMFFGFSIADNDSFNNGYDIRFEPSNRKIGIHRIGAPAFQENESASIYQWNPLENRVFVEAIVLEGWIDLCIDGNRTLISRIDKKYEALRFFTQFGDASFENIHISPMNTCL
ncbi:glycoside hydrolase family protein [Paenibacillus swuensis]|uniref:hypothetical protein n=1 Tax=Paenibacillus swuensis TaxID=1178515 RepID=UPI000838903A|nr:hypothetical protein [Paenibacillus swuensis]